MGDSGVHLEGNESYDQQSQALEAEEVRLKLNPPFPIRLLLVSIGLLVLGGILIFSGFIAELFALEDKTKGIACWVLGGIIFVPGAYYSCLFYRAWRTKNPDERQRIMKELEAVM